MTLPLMESGFDWFSSTQTIPNFCVCPHFSQHEAAMICSPGTMCSDDLASLEETVRLEGTFTVSSSVVFMPVVSQIPLGNERVLRQ